MQFPLSFSDVSLWLGAIAIILLITSESMLPHYGGTSIFIRKRRLRKAAVAVSLLFLLTVCIRVYQRTLS